MSVLRYPTVSYAVLRCPTLSYGVLCYPTVSYAILRCLTRSYAILRYPTMSYDALWCPNRSVSPCRLRNSRLTFVGLSSYAVSRPSRSWCSGVPSQTTCLRSTTPRTRAGAHRGSRPCRTYASTQPPRCSTTPSR